MRLISLFLCLLAIPSFAFDDEYRVLGVDRGATADAIDRAYAERVARRDVTLAHRRAYSTLSDPERRRTYDRQLAEHETKNASPETKQNLRGVKLREYALEDRQSPNFVDGVLRLLTREKAMALRRVLAHCPPTRRSRDQEAEFHRNYELVDVTYPVVVDLAVELAPAFLAHQPTPEDVGMYLDALDLYEKGRRANDDFQAQTAPSPRDLAVVRIKKEAQAYLLGQPGFFIESGYVERLGDWLLTHYDHTPAHRDMVRAWLTRAAHHYRKSPGVFWTAILASHPGRHHLPRFLDAFGGSAPASQLLDSVVEAMLVDGKAAHGQSYVYAVSKLMDRDPEARVLVESFGSAGTWIAAFRSPVAFCRWKLITAIRKASL